AEGGSKNKAAAQKIHGGRFVRQQRRNGRVYDADVVGGNRGDYRGLVDLLQHDVQSLAVDVHFSLEKAVLGSLVRLGYQRRGLSVVSGDEQVLPALGGGIFVLDALDDAVAFLLNGSLEFVDLRLNLLHFVVFRSQGGGELGQFTPQIRQLALIDPQVSVLDDVGN